MRYGAIVNTSAGSVPEDAVALLTEAVSAHGHTVFFPRGEDLPPDTQVSQLVRHRPDGIIVWGGDGTIAAVLSELGGHPVPVLALPGGTMNLLPRKLHNDETDWEKVLSAVLKSPKEVWIPAGIAGSARFYVAALFGRLTHLGSSREALRSGELLEAVSILAREDALAIETELEIKTPSRNASGVSAMAAAVLPRNGSDPGLEVAAIAPDSPLDLAAGAIEAVFNGWRSGADFHQRALQAVSLCHENDSIIPATIDGEPCELPCPLEVRYMEKAACVMVAGAEA